MFSKYNMFFSPDVWKRVLSNEHVISPFDRIHCNTLLSLVWIYNGHMHKHVYIGWHIPDPPLWLLWVCDGVGSTGLRILLPCHGHVLLRVLNRDVEHVLAMHCRWTFVDGWNRSWLHKHKQWSFLVHKSSQLQVLPPAVTHPRHMVQFHVRDQISRQPGHWEKTHSNHIDSLSVYSHCKSNIGYKQQLARVATVRTIQVWPRTKCEKFCKLICNNLCWKTN